MKKRGSQMHLSKLEQSGIQDLQELHSSTPEIVRTRSEDY